MGQAVFKGKQFPCNYFGCKLAGIRVTGKQPKVPFTGIGTNGETTAKIIQNGHVGTLKLPSKYSCLCT